MTTTLVRAASERSDDVDAVEVFDCGVEGVVDRSVTLSETTTIVRMPLVAYFSSVTSQFKAR